MLLLKYPLQLKLLLLTLCFFAADAKSQGPSFDCSQVSADSTEAMVCQSDRLSQLDRDLAKAYQQALSKAANERSLLKAEQRGWVKGRNECWKATNEADCVALSYQTRLSELQARYQLVSVQGPLFYQCNTDVRNELVVRYFDSDIPTAIIERGDQMKLLYKNADSSKGYVGQDAQLIQNDRSLQLVWYYQQTALNCTQKPSQ
ncbi:lysozyme inhibitor LprI family protein [Paraferrimonas haliotis]|uniref:lysozyme inhibitor LprI family protein n=1 Tax=Paraferrimonas haliotis TaxID=2013866 RepID=UPI000BA9886F|nr:lysozyme inhibitor LprI family protein [Paraferrimonas haliotis]